MVVWDSATKTYRLSEDELNRYKSIAANRTASGSANSSKGTLSSTRSSLYGKSSGVRVPPESVTQRGTAS